MTEEQPGPKTTSAITVMAAIVDDEPFAIIEHILTRPVRSRTKANAEVHRVEMRLEIADVLGLQVGLAKFLQQVIDHG